MRQIGRNQLRGLIHQTRADERGQQMVAERRVGAKHHVSRQKVVQVDVRQGGQPLAGSTLPHRAESQSHLVAAGEIGAQMSIRLAVSGLSATVDRRQEPRRMLLLKLQQSRPISHRNSSRP